MDWLTIVLLVVSGIALILIEIIFIPGTTIVGFIGVALVIGGVIIAYRDLGSQSGTISTGAGHSSWRGSHVFQF